MVRGVLNGDPVPIENAYHTTVMPIEFRVILLCIMVANLASSVAFEYYVVNWIRQRWASGQEQEVRQPTAKRHLSWETMSGEHSSEECGCNDSLNTLPEQAV